MHVRCPHCHNPIELVDETPLGEITCPSCHSSFSLIAEETVSAGPLTARKLGRFELVSPLGTGGFGTVWMARDTELDRTVAIKVPRKEQLAKEEVEQFLREARAAAQVKHPNIVAVHEVGREGDTVYIVSDYIRGVPLSSWLSGRGLTMRESVELAATIAEALHHAHEQGIVHRDLKPGNIMVETGEGGSVGARTAGTADAAGTAGPTSRLIPYITDFGLAKRDAGEITMTIEGRVLGTPAYMSPEQARGEGHHADRRTDIYSLGVILFQLLTGELLFRGDKQMLIYQVVHEEPTSPRRLKSSIPRDLETITLKCLQKNPAKRYASAADLAADLRRWLAHEPIVARPISRIERFGRWCRRKPVVAGLSAAIVVVAIAGFAAVTSQWRRAVIAEASERERRIESDANAKRADANAKRADEKALEANAEKVRADTNAKTATAKAIEARRNLYAAHMNLAQRAWQDANIVQVLQLLSQHMPKDGEDDLRNFEWYYHERLCRSDLRTFKGHSRLVPGVAFSPNGGWLASASLDGTVKLWDTATGKELRTLKGHSHEVYALAFSPDGLRLASAGGGPNQGGEVKLWDATTGLELRTLKGHLSDVLGVSFSPDGTRLASAGGVLNKSGEVRLWEARTGRQLRLLEGYFGRRVSAVIFSPDGARLATTSEDGTLRLWDATSGQELRTLKAHSPFVFSVSFSPDGARLASSGSDRTIKLWDTETGQELRSLQGHNSEVFSVSFSPDGARLASGSLDGTIKLWDIDRWQEVRTLKAHTSVYRVAFSPDGSRLASAGGVYNQPGEIKLWDVGTAPEMRVFKGCLRSKYESVQCGAISADGTRAAVGILGAGTIRILDCTTGHELREFSGHRGNVFCVSFSSDGSRVASVVGDVNGRREVKAWEVGTGKAVCMLKGDNSNVNTVEFSPDGSLLVTGGMDVPIKMWEASTGKELRALADKNQVMSVCFSPDGTRLATSGGDNDRGEIRIWDVQTGQSVRTLKGHSSWVYNACFSSNGLRLVSAGADQTVRHWDVLNGRELRAVKAYPPGSSLAFSADGKRIASGREDFSIKLWDTESGHELVTLTGANSRIRTVAFSADGRRLVAVCEDGTVNLWDGRQLTLERASEREALALLEFLCASGLTKEQTLERIRGDKIIAPGAREMALTLGADYWDRAITGEAHRVVGKLFAKLGLPDDVIQALRSDEHLRDPVRRKALEVAAQWPQDAGQLSQEVWQIVVHSDLSKDAYVLAMRQAELACNLHPLNPVFRSALGIAQYRAGRFKEALETLTNCELLFTLAGGGRFNAPNVAFIAMAQFQLGQTEKARQRLTQLREMMKDAYWLERADMQGFYGEAEALIQGKAALTKSSPPAEPKPAASDVPKAKERK